MSARAQIALRPLPQISVVIPVFNEESCLPALIARLYPALDALHRPYECIFVDDGSTDRSVALLRETFQQRPHETRIVILRGNFGQHAAIRAGFERVRGDFIVTLDADLQNPPEEIAQLVARFDEGYDYVGTIRQRRRDAWWRRKASAAMNIVRRRISGIRMTDQGCMLRGYSRAIVSAINQSREVTTFLPALGSLYALRSIEIPVRHEERESGTSKYSLYRLVRLNFDLMTGFSLVPLQLFSMAGIVIAALSFLFVVYLAVRRLLIGPEAEGVFTLFAIVFLMIGIVLFGIGLLGEYIGRIYLQVRDRPRYVVQAVIEAERGESS
ncbi:MAG TPA: glycosyltransferase [Steroidobacteraceae bacterium]|nr:glycosyltransferase [Steroidobacteraceae bacterium]